MANQTTQISTGNLALDGILKGGLTARRVYLLEGNPGTGKTTLGMQFLLEGTRHGENGLYVTLSETRSELDAVANSHGWSLDRVDIYELVDQTSQLVDEDQYTMFQPSEVELGETTRGILERVRSLNPRRVVIDSLSELRLLSQNALRYRRQILALKQFFAGRDCTVVFLDDKTSADNDLQLQSIAHGVVSLERTPSEFGDERRRLSVVKFRGRPFVGGWHDFNIVEGGLKIFPRVGSVAAPNVRIARSPLKSGNGALDRLFGTGIERGTSTLLLGPAGAGKSTCATLFAHAACLRGERALFFIFDESRQTLFVRSKGLGMNLEALEQEGLLEIQCISPGEVSPGQFAHMVRTAVEPNSHGERVSVVIIDSLNGYLSAMPEERFLQMQMHELLSYLGDLGIATFLIVAQHGMLGSAMQTPVDASYLADSVLLFRYFESAGEIRQAISVVKKRDGIHERTIREFRMENGSVSIGRPLQEFHGILAGTPTYTGSHDDLIRKHRIDEQA